MNEYYVDSQVTTWIREWFKAESDDEAIQMVKEGTYNVDESEYLYDCTEWNKDSDDEYICEVYNIEDKKIYGNYED